MFSVDFHSHILPAVDDGAKTLQDSLEMLDILSSQGIKSVVATPHFRAHRDTVQDFLNRRAEAKKILDEKNNSNIKVYLGAEIAIERGISEIENISELAYEGTDCVLLEFPYRPFSNWMMEEIEYIAYGKGLTPVIAHIDRYYDFFSTSDFNDIFSMDKVIFQVNNEAFLGRRSRSIVKTLMKNHLPFVLGSDSHNLENRRPNFDVSIGALRKYEIQPAAAEFRHNFLK